MSEEISEEARFNQAKFEMDRLHELILRVDRCNTNLLFYSDEFYLYHYQIVYNDLCSVLASISSKLKEKELKDILKIRELISEVIRYMPIWNCYLIESMSKNVNQRRLNVGNWEIVKGLLFHFRLGLETLMDEHKIGNPSKEDPRRAVVDN